MVLLWRELRARESSAIMIIEIFIAFIQAIIIFDYSETPPAPYGQPCNTLTSLLRQLLFGLLAKRPHIFLYKKKNLVWPYLRSPVNTAKFFWSIDDHINGFSLYYFLKKTLVYTKTVDSVFGRSDWLLNQ